MVADIAMVMVALEALLLIVVIATPSVSGDLPSLSALAPAMICFGGVIAIAAWSLTPSDVAVSRPFWALVAHTSAATLDRSATEIEIIKLGGLGCAFLAATAVGRSGRRLALALRLMVYLGSAFSVVAVLLSSADAIYATQGRRVEARFLNPNIAGTVFGVITVLALSQVWRRVRRGGGGAALPGLILDAACFAVAVSALLMTLSRGAIAATIVGGTVLAIWEVVLGRSRIRGVMNTRTMIAALLGGLAFIIFIAWGVTDRLFPRLLSSQADMAVRALIVTVHWRAILAAPWFGYGLGSFETVNTALLTTQNFSRLWNIRAAQNVYIQWLEQEGFVGAMSMFACVGVVMFRPLASVFRSGGSTWKIRAIIAANIVILLHGAVDFSLEAYSIAAFFALMLGLNFGAARPRSAP
jgi:O-antigen ligase